MAATRVKKQDLGASVFASPSVTLGTAASAGSSGTAVQADSTIVAFDVTAPSTQAFGDAAATGAAAVAARRDHKHAMPAAPATGLVAANFVFGEVPTGTVDGVNAAFGIANTPVAGTVAVHKNGIRQLPGAGNDYTLAGTTITFLAGNLPQTGDNLLVDYLK
jgi:hypothetical protein